MRRLAICFVSLLAGCDLYFSNGNGDDAPCANWEALTLAAEYRNPQTGECVASGPGYPCDGRCGPCPDVATAQPDWGMCYSACEGNDEGTCIKTPGCFAAYTDHPDTDEGPSFRGCWETAPSGPISTGACTGLDAQQCSRHDNCSAYYINKLARRDEAPPSDFFRCAAERGTGSCANIDCGPKTHCEERCQNTGVCQPVCVPDADLCQLIDCIAGYECAEVCTGGTNGGPGTCSAQCVPTTMCEALGTEGSCVARADCVPVYKGEDCTCTPSACECNVLTYERCETK
jgi:hypothetical protein